MRLARSRNRIRISKPEQYSAALARFDDLIGSIPGSPEAAEMDRLALALDRYEQNWGRDWVAANIRREALKYAAVTLCSLAGGFLLGDTLYKVVF